MASITETAGVGGWWPRAIAAVGRQVLLVPEGALLPILFALHGALGRPPLVALAGLLVSLAFIVRVALLLLAGRALDLGQYGRAQRLATAALRLYPFSADGLALLGLAAMARGDKGADDLLRQALRLQPTQAALHADRSRLACQRGEVADARTHAFYALLLAPRRAAGYLCLGLIALEHDHAYREAAHLSRQGLRFARHTAERALLHMTYAEALERLGERARADAELAAALEHAERGPAAQRGEVLYRAGLLALRLGETERATIMLRSVGAADPEGRLVGAAWQAARALDLRRRSLA